MEPLPELRKALLEEWANIPAIVTTRLIHSMPSRCHAIIDAEGEVTRF